MKLVTGKRIDGAADTAKNHSGNESAGLSCACCPPRRGFLTGLAALGASTLLTGCQTAAQSSAGANLQRIDVHHHLSPPP